MKASPSPAAGSGVNIKQTDGRVAGKSDADTAEVAGRGPSREGDRGEAGQSEATQRSRGL